MGLGLFLIWEKEPLFTGIIGRFGEGCRLIKEVIILIGDYKQNPRKRKSHYYWV